MASYQALYKGACELNDWGISADIARICDYNTLEQEASAEIRKWEAQLASFATACCLARGRLEAAQASIQLANFNHLALTCKCGQFARRGRVSPTAHGHANVAGG